MNLVIFDCDGTLVDSQHMIAAAMEQAFKSENLVWPGREATLKAVGLSLAGVLRALAPDLSPDRQLALAGRYREAFFALRQAPAYVEPAYEGVEDTVQRLAARGDVLLGIATGKSRRGVAAVLEHLGLTRLFRTIQTADDAPSKPHPAMVRQAMAEAGAGREESIMVGDSVYDIEMARAAGVRSVGVSWGYNPVSALEAAGADRIASDFRELEEILDALWQVRP